MWKHFPPRWPVMRSILSYIEPVINSFVPQDTRHLFIRIPAHIMSSGAEHDKHVVEIWALRVRYKIRRVIEIHVVVIVAIDLCFDIEGRTHVENIFHYIRVFKGEVG